MVCSACGNEMKPVIDSVASYRCIGCGRHGIALTDNELLVFNVLVKLLVKKATEQKPMCDIELYGGIT